MKTVAPNDAELSLLKKEGSRIQKKFFKLFYNFKHLFKLHPHCYQTENHKTPLINVMISLVYVTAIGFIYSCQRNQFLARQVGWNITIPMSLGQCCYGEEASQGHHN